MLRQLLVAFTIILMVNSVYALQVVEVSPIHNSFVPPGDEIVVLFDDSVAVNSINENTIVIRGQLSGTIPWTFELLEEQTQLIITPEPAHYGEQITVIITTDVQYWDNDDEQYRFIRQPYTWNFSIHTPAGYVDFYPLPDSPYIDDVPRCFTLGDFDYDGWIDLIAVFDQTIGIWKNRYIDQMENAYTEQPFRPNPDRTINIPADNMPSDVVCLDYDRDGDLDIAYTAYSSNELVILQNATDGGEIRFNQPLSIEPNPDRPTKCLSADMNSDGWEDLIVISSSRDRIVIYENDQNGGFNDHVIDTGQLPVDAVIADVDLDGLLDFCEVEMGSDNVWLFWGLGDFQFTGRNVGRFNNPTGITLGDMDGDSDLDIITYSEETPNYWYTENTGNRRFGISRNNQLFFRPSKILFADLDENEHNVDLDLIISNDFFHIISIASNDVNRMLTYQEKVVDPHGLTAADLDNDGDNDLIYFSHSGRKINSLFNITSDSPLDTLTISPSEIDFGEVSVHDTVGQDLTVRTGDDGITLYRVIPPQRWSDIYFADTVSTYIPPHDSIVIEISYNPNYMDVVYQDNLILEFSFGHREIIPVTGTGLQARLLLIGQSITFPSIKVGQQDSQSRSVTNTGNDTLRFDLSIRDGSQFQVERNHVDLSPGSSISIDYTFTPHDSGNHADVVYFDSNDRHNSLDSLILYGIAAPNESPVFVESLPDTLEVLTGNQYRINFRVRDESNNLNRVEFLPTPLPDWITPNLVENDPGSESLYLLEVYPDFDATALVVVATAYDDEGLNSNDSMVVLVRHRPQFVGLEDTISIRYDQFRNIHFNVIDADDDLDSVYISVGSNNFVMIEEEQNGDCFLQIVANETTFTQNIQISARDRLGAITIQNVLIIVNHPPKLIFTRDDPIIILANEQTLIPISVEDPNEDAGIPTTLDCPVWMDIVQQDSSLFVEFDLRDNNFFRQRQLTVLVEDREGLRDRLERIVIINFPPIIDFQDTIHTVAGSQRITHLEVSDPYDERHPSVQLQNNPDWVQLMPSNSEISFAPEQADTTTSFQVIATDRYNYNKSHSVIAYVDHPPEIIFPDTIYLPDDRITTLVYDIMDVDGDLIHEKVEVLGGAPWIDWNEPEREIVFSPGFTSRNKIVIITAQDARGLWDSLYVRCRVQFIDDPPTIRSLSGDNIQLVEMDTILFSVEAYSDPVENEQIELMLNYDYNQIDWITLDSVWPDEDSTYQGATYRLTPQFKDAGQYTINVEAVETSSTFWRDTTNMSTIFPIQIGVTAHAIGPQLVTKPNPFTPNNDGYNDRVGFDVQYLYLSQPKIKIFSMEGRFVRQLEHFKNQIIYWDGRNSNGHLETPGVYVYFLFDGDRKIKSGVIGMAL